MCSDPCVEKIKRENLIKLSIFLTSINVLHIYVKIVKKYWFLAPWNNTEKSDPYQTVRSIYRFGFIQSAKQVYILLSYLSNLFSVLFCNPWFLLLFIFEPQ